MQGLVSREIQLSSLQGTGYYEQDPKMETSCLQAVESLFFLFEMLLFLILASHKYLVT